ncbi:MAG: tetratricopeptide repeat protein [Gammaproteobacteria bacterium]
MNDESHGADKGFAVSLAMSEAGKDPETKERVIKYLDQQIALHDLHAENLKLQSLALRAQHRQLRSQRQHDRLRSVYQGVLSLIFLGILGIIIYAVISAATDQSVVVNQFQVPPSFVAAGNSGTVVASAFLDRLNDLQASARNSQSALALQDAWSNNIQLQVPDVHVSLGDIRRTLHQWLGHQIQINGALVEQGTQIMLTVRGTGFPAKTFIGAPDALPSLINSAADYVYGQAEPYQFATQLEISGQDTQALAVVQAAFPTASAKNKAWLLNAWGNALGDLNQYTPAADKYREAIHLNPKFWIAYTNLESVQMYMGEEEAAYQTGVNLERHAHRGSWFAAHVDTADYEYADYLRMDLPALHAELVADEAAHGGVGTNVAPDPPTDAEMLARMHADRQASFILQSTPGAGSDHFVVAATNYVQGLMALNRRDYPTAASALETTASMITQYPVLQSDFNSPPACYLGLAEEMAGHPDKADAAIVKGGHYVDCYRFKADIAAHRGNWKQAQQDYQAAVNLAPSLPMAYQSWGLALLQRGDYKGAMEKFQQANQRGLHWCDPLKYWGDALAAQGNYKAAIQKYVEAAKYTPGWGALELAWGQALDNLGNHQDALNHYQTARGSEDLNTEQQAKLSSLLGKTG